MEEIQKQIEDAIAEREDLQADEEQRNFVAKQMELKKIGEAFLTDEHWKEELQTLKRMKVLKMPQVIKSLMYLMGFTKEEICMPNS